MEWHANFLNYESIVSMKPQRTVFTESCIVVDLARQSLQDREDLVVVGPLPLQAGLVQID